MMQNFGRAVLGWLAFIIAAILALLAIWSITESAEASPGLRAIVAEEARRHGVPVRLAYAVVSIESTWRPRVRGRAGEIGLMQIKPATARMMGFRGSSRRLYSPRVNARYAMRYLAKAYRKAGGNVCRAVSYYNRGLGSRGISRRYCAKARRYVARYRNVATGTAARRRMRITAASISRRTVVRSYGLVLKDWQRRAFFERG